MYVALLTLSEHRALTAEHRENSALTFLCYSTDATKETGGDPKPGQPDKKMVPFEGSHLPTTSSPYRPCLMFLQLTMFKQYLFKRRLNRDKIRGGPPTAWCRTRHRAYGSGSEHGIGAIGNFGENAGD